ncbi:ankyrin repeat domain-containing protein 53 [Oryctolagus cuniculus]|uniref:ankyrin repeat domain-containing protein 53 n=1 Tax=Oryctolagus cuniculus TaxID=9986 RepID=UPI003879897E
MLGLQGSGPGGWGRKTSEAPGAAGRVPNTLGGSARSAAAALGAAQGRENQATAPGRPGLSRPLVGRERAGGSLAGKDGEQLSPDLLRLAPSGGHQVSLKVIGNTPESRLPSPIEESDQRVFGNYYQLFAASVGDVEWLRFCLNQRRGEIEANDKGFAAIHLAAQQGQLTCLQVLIDEYEFPVDLPTHGGETALHLVIHKDNEPVALPCIQYLLEKGANLDAQTHNGSTPLHLAACEGLLGCVKVLVQRGANVHAQDALGCKPIDYCKMWNHRTCARFLKDAMWKRDKDDFAREMGKVKRLKEQLALIELDYLTEYQKEHKVLREEDFTKWLRCKLFNQRHSLLTKDKQVASTRSRPTILPKTSEYQGPQTSQSSQPWGKKQLGSIQQCPARLPTKPIYRRPPLRRPKMWNPSNNPASSPPTQFSYPQGIRLGVHPDSCREQDFSSFLEVIPGPHGYAWLHTANGHWVAPVPRLPLEVMVRELYPQKQPYRMKVPQGFRAITIKDVPHKRHLDNRTFWTDTLAMSLRETFDEGFLANVRAHRGLPALPTPTSPL